MLSGQSFKPQEAVKSYFRSAWLKSKGFSPTHVLSFATRWTPVYPLAADIRQPLKNNCEGHHECRSQTGM
jgi:hypothetical protein